MPFPLLNRRTSCIDTVGSNAGVIWCGVLWVMSSCPWFRASFHSCLNDSKLNCRTFSGLKIRFSEWVWLLPCLWPAIKSHLYVTLVRYIYSNKNVSRVIIIIVIANIYWTLTSMPDIMLSVLHEFFMWLLYHYNNFMMLKWLIQGHTAKEWKIWNQKPGLSDSRLPPWMCVC